MSADLCVIRRFDPQTLMHHPQPQQPSHLSFQRLLIITQINCRRIANCVCVCVCVWGIQDQVSIRHMRRLFWVIIVFSWQSSRTKTVQCVRDGGSSEHTTHAQICEWYEIFRWQPSSTKTVLCVRDGGSSEHTTHQQILSETSFFVGGVILN